MKKTNVKPKVTAGDRMAAFSPTKFVVGANLLRAKQLPTSTPSPPVVTTLTGYPAAVHHGSLGFAIPVFSSHGHFHPGCAGTSLPQDHPGP
jgi:hypothetical protein